MPTNKRTYKESQKKWRDDNKDYIRDAKYQTEFGISLKEYEDLLKLQNYSCAICNTHISKLRRNLAVDHCHETDRVRGLLCTNCNIGLGNFKDNSEYLKQAIIYLT